MMKLVALISMMTCFNYISEVSAQQINAHFQLGTTGGYVTNTWLNPALSEWDRSSTSTFFQISPVVHLQYLGTKQMAAVTGMVHFHHLTDGRPDWTGGTTIFNARQLLGRLTSLTLTTGANRFQSSYRRDLMWIQAGLDWLVSPVFKMEIKTGSNWRTYSNINDSEDITNRYDAYGLEAEYWISHRWQLGGRFYSSLDHITEPGKGFTSSLSLTHHTRDGLNISLQTGLDQFSQQYQTDAPGGFFPPVTGRETLTIDDRFVRTGISARYPVLEQMLLNARFSNMLWMSSADNTVLPDYEVSAGVEFRFSPVMRSAGKISSMNWDTLATGEMILELRYHGNDALYLTGNFNDWDQPGIPLRKTGRNRYSANIELEPGIYQYKILVRKNGELEWIDLAGITGTADDGFGGRNGIIIIENRL